jgi:hypothetical protein
VRGRRVDTVQKNVYMYVNANMVPVETVPGIEGVLMMEGVNSSIIYLIHCKNLCKCHNVPLPHPTIKGKKK